MDDTALASLQDALDANKEYMQYLQSLYKDIHRKENDILGALREAEHRVALRRASIAVKAFSQESTNASKQRSITRKNAIRPHLSFFHDLHQRKKRSASREEGDEIEPEPNEDTQYLRKFYHKGFHATISPIFSAGEQACVRSYAEKYLRLDMTRVQDRKEWDNILSMYPKVLGKRSAFSCQLRYLLHDAPNLRLCAWTKEEDQKLQELASGKDDPEIVRHWDEVAKRMPYSGRPPVHCLIRYQTKLCPSNLKSKFTAEEDKIICDGIKAFGEHWNMIADQMDGRVGEQIRYRWQQSLSPNLRQGKFSIIEDRRLLLALYAYHNNALPLVKDAINWHEISHHVPGRLPPQLRDRYLNSLNPEVTFRAWTDEEDQELLRLVEEYGEDELSPGLWSSIASKLDHRTDNQVFRRWKVLAPLQHNKRQVAKKRKKSLPVFFQRAFHRKRSSNPSQCRSSYIGTEASLESS